MRKTIGGIVLEEDKVLLVNKNGTLILPGGKPEEGESDIKAMYREFKEELSGTLIDPLSVSYFHTARGISPNKGTPIEVVAYRVELASELGAPSAEILGREFLDYFATKRFLLSSITREIVEEMHKRNLF